MLTELVVLVVKNLEFIFLDKALEDSGTFFIVNSTVIKVQNSKRGFRFLEDFCKSQALPYA